MVPYLPKKKDKSNLTYLTSTSSGNQRYTVEFLKTEIQEEQQELSFQ